METTRAGWAHPGRSTCLALALPPLEEERHPRRANLPARNTRPRPLQARLQGQAPPSMKAPSVDQLLASPTSATKRLRPSAAGAAWGAGRLHGLVGQRVVNVGYPVAYKVYNNWPTLSKLQERGRLAPLAMLSRPGGHRTRERGGPRGSGHRVRLASRRLQQGDHRAQQTAQGRNGLIHSWASSACPTSLPISRERRCGARRLQGLVSQHSHRPTSTVPGRLPGVANDPQATRHSPKVRSLQALPQRPKRGSPLVLHSCTAAERPA